jgi:acetyl esterase/lipase
MNFKFFNKVKIFFLIAFLSLGHCNFVFSMSSESLIALENIQKFQLNRFNLKEIVECEQLQSTRDAYESTLLPGKQNMLDKFKVSQKKTQINGIIVYEYRPTTVISDKVCLYVHGGAFALLSADSSYDIPIQTTSLAGIRVISVDYGLAPENKYSDMMNQIEAVVNGILSEGYLSECIVLLGDSAGGALCVSTAHRLSVHGVNLGGIILLSPWLDLSCELIGEQDDDPVLSKKNYLDFASSLVIEAEDDKKLTPFFLKYTSDFPKIMIQFGTREILLNQIVKFSHLLEESGLCVKTECYGGLWHVFQSNSDLPETQTAMGSLRNFINSI